MRVLKFLGGATYCLLATGGSYVWFNRATPRPPHLERQALPPPTQATPRPAAVPAATAEPRIEMPPPADEPAPPRVAPAIAVPPSTALPPAQPFRVSPLVMGAPPRPAPAPVAPAAPPTPSPTDPFGNPVGLCLVCGEPALSYVEVDGRRQGYCPRHQSKLKIPIPSPAPVPSSPTVRPEAPPPTATGASARPAEGGQLAQCQGMTRAGGRCRRNTRDPSGFCYQHRR